ncbi:Enamine deaminase RidA, house cleaning of reactive enamine intermediates, YjgF/YER057c/UK114 family [Arthrobacter alpinus]|uniref:Enamine deaminase RidA, house cleaning of reactive enamine intermediates, YjgF/YER057c/UK114 family n=1 Tax=Arthrobacter alpinus TaxID=656366 RepID=A0A1H5I7K3_9MICC|nr:RidA family protein [Arthrobacter alpinus]SEE36213.1 Enamine deaminase RidA, house cleaning of reactive enamine intermediates, YjgF/YER057c/UK114 family [Arthrobacter alpinus]
MIRRVGRGNGTLLTAGAASEAVIANGFVFVSGQVPDHVTSAADPSDFGVQVRQALANLEQTLTAAGSGMDRVVKVTTFLTDPRLADYNVIYAEAFGSTFPARTTVMVADSDHAIEIQCIAVAGDVEPAGSIRRIANVDGMAPVLGPYSQAVVANGFVFTSGQTPAITSMADQPERFGGKVRQVLANLDTVLTAAGSSMDQLAKVTTYLTDPGQLLEYNDIYAETIGADLPARTSCSVDIWDIALEIECIAALDCSSQEGTAIKRFATFPGLADSVGPFSQAVLSNGFIFTTGQIPLIGSVDERPHDFAGSVRQVLLNLNTVLEGAGSNLESVVNVTTYLTSLDQRDVYERIYAEVFGEQLPATTSVCVGIWDFTFEIQCIAVGVDES